MKYIMALDQGTTSSRCILFDHAGNICAVFLSADKIVGPVINSFYFSVSSEYG